MASLRLIHPGEKVVASGSVTGNRYEWIRPNGLVVEVDDGDVPELKALKYKQGCDCSKHGGSYEPIQHLPYFEEV